MKDIIIMKPKNYVHLNQITLYCFLFPFRTVVQDTFTQIMYCNAYYYKKRVYYKVTASFLRSHYWLKLHTSIMIDLDH